MFQHAAMFAVRPQFHPDRTELAEELKVRLESLRESPFVISLHVWVSDGTSSHDVLLLAHFASHDQLEELRGTPEHRSLIDWYQIYFDDGLRATVDGINDEH
jgi:hypothetical protein